LGRAQNRTLIKRQPIANYLNRGRFELAIISALTFQSNHGCIMSIHREPFRLFLYVPS
jgi:hypothetical protein